VSTPLPGRAARWHALAIAALGLVLSAAPHASARDAVPPPPLLCPPGYKGVTSHAGPKCEQNAPRNCPTGWDGVLGGNCVLMPCPASGQCHTGYVCVEHAVCLQPKQDDFYDYNETPAPAPAPTTAPSPPAAPSGSPDKEGALPRAPEAPLGEPLPARVRRPTPIFRYEAVNLCSPAVACAAPATCQTEKLCVPAGKRAVAYLGPNIQPVRVARQSETPLTTSGAAATEAAASASGCGCSVGARTGHAWLVAAFAVAGALARRSARRGGTRRPA
jgi:hypothetical protein